MADSVNVDEDGSLQLSITANRRAQALDKTLSSVTIITKDEIEKSQASSVQELLQATAGLQLVNNGGAGKVTSLFMRGTESDHTLVLLDGIKINSGSNGGAALQLIAIEMIERIEIVRGPKTSLYGSDAIGGVIQIFTKKGKPGESAKPTVSAKIGSHGLRSVTAGVTGGFTKGHYSISLKSEKTDGYNACTGDSVLFAGCFTEELDDDGYENKSVSLNFGYQLTDKTKFSTNYLRSENDVEFDGAAPFSSNSAEITSQVYGVSLSSQINDKAEIVLSAGHSDNKNKNFQSGAFFSDYNTSRNSYSLQGNIDLSKQSSLTVGTDYFVDKADKITNYVAPSRTTKGVFAQYQRDLGKSNFQVGLRHDYSKQYGGQTTGNIGVGHAINDQLRFTASYSTAFKAPTFDELYFPFFGVPTMKPEEANVLEFGFKGKKSWGNWSTSIFRNKVDNLIVYKSDFSSAGNIDKAVIDGFEAIVSTRVAGWDLKSNLTLLDAEDRSGKANHGKKLARRPAKSLRLSMDKGFGKFKLGASMIAEGHRFDNASNTRRIAGYTTADIRASYKLSKDLSVQAKVANIFDKKYETISYFPQDGRNYTLSLNYSPK